MHMPNTTIPTTQSQKQEVRAYSWWSWRRRGVPSTSQNQGPSQETPTDIKEIAPTIEEQVIVKEVKMDTLSPSPPTEKG